MKKRYIVHRDIKLENIVVCDNDIIKITDFGNSVHVFSRKRDSISGTREYLSPVIYIKDFKK